MHHHLKNLDVKVLETSYLKEVEVLKFKILSGASCRDITKQRNKATSLALAIHRKHYSADPIACINTSPEIEKSFSY
jgi:hypothetical protein